MIRLCQAFCDYCSTIEGESELSRNWCRIRYQPTTHPIYTFIFVPSHRPTLPPHRFCGSQRLLNNPEVSAEEEPWQETQCQRSARFTSRSTSFILKSSRCQLIYRKHHYRTIYYTSQLHDRSTWQNITAYLTETRKYLTARDTTSAPTHRHNTLSKTILTWR